MSAGKVYLIGAGPGDPGLITTKGRAHLETADAVVFDRLVAPRLLALARPEAELIDVGKSSGEHTLPQAEIEQLLIDLAQRGLRVVRLKGGDPFVFGRGGEEALALEAAGVDWEVVPGITSAVAVPAYAGIPVTHRNVSPGFTVVTGHRAADGTPVNWSLLAQSGNTLVVLMGVQQLDSIATELMSGGLAPNTPVAVIRWGTRAHQQTLTGVLGQIANQVKRAGVKPPAVIVIGDVVAARSKLAWLESMPMFGQRHLVLADTRAQAERRAAELESAGAEVFPLSLEHVVDAEVGWAETCIADAATDSCAGIYFRSAFAVELFFRACRQLHLDVRRVSALLVADNENVAEGLLKHGVQPDGIGERALWTLQHAKHWWLEMPHPETEWARPETMFRRVGLKDAQVHPFVPYRPRQTASLVTVARHWIADQSLDGIEFTAGTRWLADALSVELVPETMAVGAR